MVVSNFTKTCFPAQPVIHFMRMITLLVVTSDFPFGELIRQNIEEMGRFTVRVAPDIKSAVSCAKETNCPLVFLDTRLAEKDLLDIGKITPGQL